MLLMIHAIERCLRQKLFNLSRLAMRICGVGEHIDERHPLLRRKGAKPLLNIVYFCSIIAVSIFFRH